MKVLLGENYFNYYTYIKIRVQLKSCYPLQEYKKRPLYPTPNSSQRARNPERQRQRGTTEAACRSWEIRVASSKHKQSLEYILL